MIPTFAQLNASTNLKKYNGHSYLKSLWQAKFCFLLATVIKQRSQKLLDFCESKGYTNVLWHEELDSALIFLLNCSNFWKFVINFLPLLVLIFYLCWQPGEQATIIILMRQSMIWSNSYGKCQTIELFDFCYYLSTLIR